MNNMIEKRRYSRIPISSYVQVRLDSGVLVEGLACNASLNGLLFETERTLPLGSRVKIKMTVGHSADKTDILCTGAVTRLEVRGVAIEIDRIDEDSLMCLCNLIRKAAVDAVRLEAEIERRLGTTYFPLSGSAGKGQ